MNVRPPRNDEEPIEALVGALPIDELAIPSNIRRGEQIEKQGGVVITEHNNSSLTMKVMPDQTRTVTFTRDERSLSWRCTCTRRTDLFCKHLAAAVLHLRHHAASDRVSS